VAERRDHHHGPSHQTRQSFPDLGWTEDCLVCRKLHLQPISLNWVLTSFRTSYSRWLVGVWPWVQWSGPSNSTNGRTIIGRTKRADKRRMPLLWWPRALLTSTQRIRHRSGGKTMCFQQHNPLWGPLSAAEVGHSEAQRSTWTYRQMDDRFIVPPMPRAEHVRWHFYLQFYVLLLYIYDAPYAILGLR
jgi:hypothetical protein